MNARRNFSLAFFGAVVIAIAVALFVGHRRAPFGGPGPRSAREGRPSALSPSDPPYLEVAFTRPEPGKVPGVRPEDTAIRDLVERLLDETVHVAGDTDVRAGIYDWDQFWNGGPDARNPNGGTPRDGWPDPICGETFCCGADQVPDCDPRRHSCTSTGCGPASAAPFCKVSWDPVERMLARGIALKALFNRGKSKAPVRQWLAQAIDRAPCRMEDPSNAERFCGVKVCSRGMDDDCTPGGACLGSGNLHVKALLLRKLRVFGGSEHNVFLTSANFDYDQLLRWNDAVVVYNDEKLYDGLRAHYDAMWDAADAPRAGYADALSPADGSIGRDGIIEGSHGIVRAYLFPRNEHDPKKVPAGQGEASVDVLVRILDRVETGTILVVTGWFSTHRPQIPAKLIELAKTRGVDVRVLIDPEVEEDDPAVAEGNSVLDALTRGGVRVRVTTVSIHHKLLLVAGDYQGSFQRVVLTGTPNFTGPALRRNDEVLFEIRECETPPCSRARVTWAKPPTGSEPNNDLFSRYEDQWAALCRRSKRFRTGAEVFTDCDVVR